MATRCLLLAGLGFGVATVIALGANAPVAVVPPATANGVTVGGGYVRSSGREVVRTAGNVVYVVTSDDNPCQLSGGAGVIRVSKGLGAQTADPNVPTSFAEQDAAHHPVASQTGQICTWNAYSNLFGPDVRLDRSGVIHLAYIDPSAAAANVWYQTFSTTSDTWGPRTLVGTGATKISGAGWPRAGQVALTLDANDVPQVVWATSGAANSLRYSSRAGGAWSAPVTLASGSNLMNPSMVTALDGTIHLAWLDNSLAAHATIRYARLAGGTWGAVETVTASDPNVLANGDDDQSPSLVADTSNVPHVVYLDGTVNGADNVVRERYRRTDGSWVDNTPPGGSGGASTSSGTWYAHDPAGYVSAGGDGYVLLGHDVNLSPAGFEWQSGGAGNPWGPYTLSDPRNKTNTSAGTDANGIDGSASVRFDPLRDNNPSIIDVVYFDERDGTAGYAHHSTIYYKAIETGQQQQPPPTDTTPPVVCVAAPVAGALSGTVTLRANATDDVGVVGVQFKVDGTNLNTEDTTAPFSTPWDTTTATNGPHSITAVAHDAHSNSTTTSTTAVTVNNTGC